MLKVHSALEAVFRFSRLAAVVAPALLLVGTAARADDDRERGDRKAEPAVRLLKSVPIKASAKMYSFDISWVDQRTGTYYLADRSNKAVEAVANESTNTQITPNNGHAAFAGFVPCSPPAGANDCAGPNGVVSAYPWLFVTDAPSRLLAFDLRFTPPKTTGEISTAKPGGDPTRADELAYDPRDELILSINNAANPPYGTLIKFDPGTGTFKVVTQIFLDKTRALAAFGVTATNGAEQPVWDPKTGKFYLSVPEINGDGGTNLHGAVLRISTTGKVEALYPVDFCGPAGLALGPKGDLLVGCNTIFDTVGNKWTTNADRDIQTADPQYVILEAATGKIEAHVRGAGVGDEVWFNNGDNHYYAAASGSNLAPNAITPARPPVGTATTAPVLTAQGAATLDVIDALSETLDQRVPTLNVPAVTGTGTGVHPAATAHSVAADSETNHVFVPIGANNAFPNCLNGCVAIYGRHDPDRD
jgi:sugar lactone lactonase YvrE